MTLGTSAAAPGPFDRLKMRRLEALDANRHDHGVRLVGDEACPVIDFHQAAGDREPPLGKMTRVSPAFTALISVRIAIGLTDRAAWRA